MSKTTTSMKIVRVLCYIALAVSPEVIQQLSALKTTEEVSALIWTQWTCIVVSISLPMWAVIRAYIDQSYGRVEEKAEK